MNKPLESYFPEIVSEVKGFAIYMIDEEGIILTWNIGCELMKGYKAEEVIGQNYSILFPDFLRAEGFPQKEINIANENGRFEGENWRRKKLGDLFWANVVLTKITDEAGNLVGYVKIAQDQSEKRKFQDQLESKIEDYKKINSELNSFANTASHDLKVPIDNLEGLTLMLKEDLEQEEIGNKGIYTMVDLMHQSAIAFKEIITQMAKSAFAEVEEYTYLSFKEVVDEIKLLLAKDINAKKVIFKEDYFAAPFIRYPRNHIYSILQNLITNAIKYKSPHRNPEISIKTFKSGTCTVLEVSDNGIGIKEEDYQRVFVMYERLEEGKKEEGSGVGLGLVAKIVEGNQGKIELESKVDEGSTFKIFLK